MIRQINNEELLSYLKERDEVFEQLEYQTEWDDISLAHYNSFKKSYNSLTQLEKDIWYLAKTIGTRRTAELMQVSQRYIRGKLKVIAEKVLTNKTQQLF